MDYSALLVLLTVLVLALVLGAYTVIEIVRHIHFIRDVGGE